MIQLNKILRTCPFILIPLVFVSCNMRNDYVKSLKGQWKFTIGDNAKWADPAFDDSKWEHIYAPSNWEDQGYRGYNGFAWYRKSVRIAQKYANNNLFLNLGRIDDADEVYFNGKLIGSTGTFPPNYLSAHNTTRKYFIPSYLIKYNEDNLIAVRVYDNRKSGGITSGDLGLYILDIVPVDLNLAGYWKFHLFDSSAYKNVDFNDSAWNSIRVPGYYEDQGYKDYDGFSWYRKTFDMPSNLLGQKLVLVMGKIDDIDEVYLNGKLIGNTGIFHQTGDSIQTNDYYDEFRGYYVPDNVQIKPTGNVISVRVYDSSGGGGIYEGPVGFILQDNYSKYWENLRNRHRSYNN